MCRFIETIRIEKGQIRNLAYHERRMNEVRREVWGLDEPVSLEPYLDALPFENRTRCRVTYARKVEKVEYFAYQVRPIHSLQLVDGGQVAYSRKAADRSALNALFAQRGGADDILMVRHGWLTDTSIANIALWDGEAWYTPEHPLLAGTHRAFLLDEGVIRPRPVHVDSLSRYHTIRLFNAMIGFGEVELDCRSILPLR